MKTVLQSLIIAFCLCVAIGAKAQRPCFAKMSPLVREACLTASNDTVQKAKPFSPKAARRIIAFVKTDGKNPRTLDGCDILAAYGNLCIASIPITNLSKLSRLPEVKRIEAGRGTKAMMDTTNIIIGSSVLHRGTNLPQKYTGKGVVVGVQDIGFDLTHPTFYSADMKTYRIKAMWDQLSTDTVGSKLPTGRDYKGEEELLKIAHPRDGLIQTHGTHTAGIAAGSGSEGMTPPETESAGNAFSNTGTIYSGVAPEADICLVCNVTSDDASLISPDDYYKYTYALDALGFKYIFDYADSVGKPCVINFSEGSYQDFKGDDMLYYEMLDSLSGPGHIIVSAAGNEGNKINYLHKPQGRDTATILATSSWHGKTMSFTTLTNGDFKLSLFTNDGDNIIKEYDFKDVLAAADSTLHDSTTVDGDSLAIAITAYKNCYDKEQTVADWVINSNHYIYPSKLKIVLTGADTDVELYANSASLSNTNDNSEPAGNNSHCILSPGSAPSVISVGMTGYRTKYTNYLGQLKDFGGATNGGLNVNSSVGPTYDGRIKPDVTAPGQNIISAYSSYYIEHNPKANDINSDVRHFAYNGRTYAWNANMGTSMSSPVVAGTIALWLQANPRLTPQDCFKIFAQTCTHHDPNLSYPNNLYGYGQIDAEAGLRLILEKTTGIKTVRNYKKDNRIYSIDGRFMGTDASRLSPGIYIINGKKLLIDRHHY